MWLGGSFSSPSSADLPERPLFLLVSPASVGAPHEILHGTDPPARPAAQCPEVWLLLQRPHDVPRVVGPEACSGSVDLCWRHRG